jgi:hypothetical protein
MNQGDIDQGNGEADGRKWAEHARIEELREVDTAYSSVLPGLRAGDSSALDTWNGLWSRLFREDSDSLFRRICFGSAAYQDRFVASVREVLHERTK